MEAIQNLAQYNWFVVVSAVIVAMLAFKFLTELFGWFINKFGIETTAMREKREDKALLKKTSKNLDALQMKHTTDEEKFRKDLNEYMRESREDRIAIHEEMKQYSQNRIDDRKQSLQIQEELNDAIRTISNSNIENHKQIISLIQSQKEMLAEKINEKYKYYLSINGVPEDERDEFISLHDAYKLLGGNHTGDAKFEYCMNHLPIIPVETKLAITDNE